MGMIAALSKSPRLTRLEWQQFIASHANLRPPEPSVGKNPFTGEAKVVEARWDEAHGIAEGRPVVFVEAAPTFSEDGELYVYAAAPETIDEARAFVSALAKDLGSSIEWIDDPD